MKELVEFAEIGLRSLEREWLKILDNRPNLSLDGLKRLKREPVVMKLLDDIERARRAIKAAKRPGEIPAASFTPLTAHCSGSPPAPRKR